MPELPQWSGGIGSQIAVGEECVGGSKCRQLSSEMWPSSWWEVRVADSLKRVGERASVVDGKVPGEWERMQRKGGVTEGTGTVCK